MTTVDTDLVTLDELLAARERIAGAVVRTPLLPCPWSDPARPLWLKPENLQPIGAFKQRGAYNAIASLAAAERARGVVAFSSGNHAQAVAYAARAFGVRAVIVIPDVASPAKIEATRALGAEVVMATLEHARATAFGLADTHGYVLVPPFDDRNVIAGQGTIGLEILDDIPEPPAAVLVPVGGGGLVSGIATAVKLTSPSVRVIGVEPELAGDAAASLRAGDHLAWSAADTVRTIADGLRGTSVGVLPWQHIRARVDDVVTVTEDEIREAVRVLAHRARLVAEPSGAVATAAYLFHGAELGVDDGPIASVVSGGNVDPRAYADILAAGRLPPGA